MKPNEIYIQKFGELTIPDVMSLVLAEEISFELFQFIGSAPEIAVKLEPKTIESECRTLSYFINHAIRDSNVTIQHTKSVGNGPTCDKYTISYRNTIQFIVYINEKDISDAIASLSENCQCWMILNNLI